MNRTEDLRSCLLLAEAPRPSAVLRQRVQEAVRSAPGPGGELLDARDARAQLRGLLRECVVANRTIAQLQGQLRKFAQRPESVTFAPGPRRRDALAELADGLNICTATVALLRERLDQVAAQQHSAAQGGASVRLLARLWGARTAAPAVPPDARPSQSLLEHCGLVLGYLEAFNGRVTEALEAHKLKQKQRERLLQAPRPSPSYLPSKAAPGLEGAPAAPGREGAPAAPQQSMLQLENTRMMEEMANELLRGLASTEAQVLELARLQASLQTHLHAQFLTAARIFDDSAQCLHDTHTGNAYLRRTAKDSSAGARLFVLVVLLLGLVLLLLHHFRQ